MARLSWSTANYLLKTNALGLTAVPMTLACWFNPSSLAAATCPICVQATGVADLFDLQVLSTGKLIAEVGNVSTYTPATSNSTTITTGSWWHIAGVYASNVLRTPYVNGTAATADTTSKTPNPANINRIYIGKQSSGTPATGTVAFVGLWNIDLQAADITSLANGAHPTTVQPGKLVACLNLTGAIQTNEPDLVNSATNWTVNGAPTEGANPRIYLR